MPTPTFTTVCTKSDQIAANIYDIRFARPADFSYNPGQFVMWTVPLLDNPQDTQPRAYSIASSPDEDELIFVVKYLEGGRASEWIKHQLKPGDEVQMQGPLGRFGAGHSGGETLMICTSTGVAPFRSMLRHHFMRQCDARVDLIFGFPTADEIFWLDELRDLAQLCHRFFFHPVLSRPTDDWKGHRGRVQQVIPQIAPDLTQKQIYICGNPAMTNDVKKLCLEEWGIEKPNLHVEGFI